MTSRQVHTLYFNSTPMTSYRTLNKLHELKYLHRVERRIPGGAAGGSGQYVYSPGREGHRIYLRGSYTPDRRVNYHKLTIVDCHIVVRQLQAEGKLRILGFDTEDDSWTEIAGIELRPDVHYDLERRQGDLKLWLEIDMGTEGHKQVRGQLEAYWRAYSSYTDSDRKRWPVFPYVLWVAVDAEREKELRWLVNQMPEDARFLFKVTTLEKLPLLLTR